MHNVHQGFVVHTQRQLLVELIKQDDGVRDVKLRIFTLGVLDYLKQELSNFFEESWLVWQNEADLKKLHERIEHYSYFE